MPAAHPIVSTACSHSRDFEKASSPCPAGTLNRQPGVLLRAARLPQQFLTGIAGGGGRRWVAPLDAALLGSGGEQWQQVALPVKPPTSLASVVHGVQSSPLLSVLEAGGGGTAAGPFGVLLIVRGAEVGRGAQALFPRKAKKGVLGSWPEVAHPVPGHSGRSDPSFTTP